mgnify:FL=1
MKYDLKALQDAQRAAWNLMKSEKGVAQDKSNVTEPAVLRAELVYANTTSIYQFQFAANAAIAPTTALNNQTLGENDIFWIYGIQILYGSGATSNNRPYYSRGFTPSDDILYNGTMEVNIESRNPVLNLPMQMFREEGEINTMSGLVFINPLRRLTGKYSNFMVSINLGKTAVNIAAATLTANGYISCLLHGAQARP